MNQKFKNRYPKYFIGFLFGNFLNRIIRYFRLTITLQNLGTRTIFPLPLNDKNLNERSKGNEHIFK